MIDHYKNNFTRIKNQQTNYTQFEHFQANQIKFLTLTKTNLLSITKMSQFAAKNKKMTFNEYESKLSQTNRFKKGKNKAQSTKTSNQGKIPYQEKKFQQIQSIMFSNKDTQNRYRQSGLIPTTHLDSTDKNSKQISSRKQNQINPDSSIVYKKSNSRSQRPQRQLFVSDQHRSGQNQSDMPQSNMPQQNMPQTNMHQSNQQEEVSKLDLIFEKQPQDVQRKLRQLLLNYNAVMQYNQDEDKFQVDLLLPFNSPEQKDKFINKFIKTRHYVHTQIAQGQLKQQQQSLKHYKDGLQHHQTFGSMNESQHIGSAHQNSQTYQNFNPDYISQKKTQEDREFKDAQNVLSTSLLQEAQKIQEQKQIKQKFNEVDFYLLSQSLDKSIQKALQKISHNNSSSLKVDKRELMKFKVEKEIVSKQQNVEQPSMKDQKTEETSKHKNRLEQSPSLIQSQISQGLKANVPNSIERNMLNTPSRYDNKVQKRPFQQLKVPEFQKDNEFNSDSSYKETQKIGNLYESPIGPYKQHNASDLYERSNESSNQILIEEELPSDEQLQSDVPPNNGRYGQSKTYENSYYSNDNSQQYNSAFDMIEQTAEQHQEQIQHNFQIRPLKQVPPSPEQHQQYLKMKLKAATKNIKNQILKPTVDSVSNSKAIPNPRQSQRDSVNRKSGPGSSLRKKYAQFLNSNHKKIENLYLRIGNELIKSGKRKSQFQRPNSDHHSMRDQADELLTSQVQTGEILVVQSDQDEGQAQGDYSVKDKKQIQEVILEQYKQRIVLQNQSMSSEDKVRYFRYLARHAKALYSQYMKNHNNPRRN